MLGKIKQLGTESVIYGAMTITGRFLNFLLVPFYTNVLLPGEYGIVAYLFSIIAFLTIFFSYGMESAYFKYASTGELGEERLNFSTPLLSLLLTSLVCSVIITSSSGEIASLLGLGEQYAILILFAAWILFFDTAALIPFASLRLKHRPGIFALIKLVNISINVLLNVVFIAVMGYGVKGVFLAGLIASIVTFIILIPVCRHSFAFVFSFELWKRLLKFGIPYLPAGVAVIAIQVIDRPILKMLTDESTVGIYQANYRLGIVMMLLVSTFDYAYRPFFLNNANRPDAKVLYARVATYFTIAMAAVWIFMTTFVYDIASFKIAGYHIIHPDYWKGIAIVPVVLFAYMFAGWSSLLMPGIFIEKKTNYLPLVNGCAAIVNIGMNLLLIPIYGIMGAAYATLGGYMVMSLGMYLVSQRFYPVQYETGRLVIIVAVFTVFAVALYYGIFIREMEFHIVYKVFAFLAFPLLFSLTGFLRNDERAALRRYFRFK